MTRTLTVFIEFVSKRLKMKEEEVEEKEEEEATVEEVKRAVGEVKVEEEGIEVELSKELQVEVLVKQPTKEEEVNPQLLRLTVQLLESA